ncbi:molybdopterin-dependent oxidoreductase [Angustibacter sp. McL0619]|uniref:molybdopterin-dependent oxidoreductase n=1 Tax=Angustibacter sp. McL0619 TaxID=3415676 RepID=UPI003CF7A9AE
MSVANQQVLPPGQRLANGWPELHYGRVPADRVDRWSLTVTGSTESGHDHELNREAFAALPRTTSRGDLHCVTRWTVPDNLWLGVAARTILDLFPPAADAEFAMVWAEYGYSANLRLSDLASPRSVLATHRDGEPLSLEHGWPVRLVVPHLYAYKGPKWLRGIEYLTQPGRGFWEQRGYHAVGDAWREERWAYQE